MYLKQLYENNRLLFLAVVLFICGQMFVVLIWGIVITPFYNYGMYSEVMEVKKEYPVFEIEPDGRLLRGEDYSAQQWDKILMPLHFFADINNSNRLYQTDIKRLLTKMHLSAPDEKFLVQCNYQQFENWYKNYLQTITKQHIGHLIVRYHTYQYQFNKLQPTATALHLAQLCH